MYTHELMKGYNSAPKHTYHLAAALETTACAANLCTKYQFSVSGVASFRTHAIPSGRHTYHVPRSAKHLRLPFLVPSDVYPSLKTGNQLTLQNSSHPQLTSSLVP